MTSPSPNAGDATQDAARFRTTNWGLVTEAADSSSPAWATALDELCQAYWRPVYAFIRKRGHNPEAAQDLTQEFFARLLQSDFLARADSAKGRFRSFLMTSIDNFLRVEHRNATTQKRGGGWERIALDGGEAERAIQAELADSDTPERAFEREWARTLLAKVLGTLEQEFAASGRSALCEALRPHLSGDPGTLPYKELAARLGVSVTGIKVSAHRARQRYQELLREEMSRVVGSPAEVDDELRHLLQRAV